MRETYFPPIIMYYRIYGRRKLLLLSPAFKKKLRWWLITKWWASCYRLSCALYLKFLFSLTFVLYTIYYFYIHVLICVLNVSNCWSLRFLSLIYMKKKKATKYNGHLFSLCISQNVYRCWNKASDTFANQQQ